MQTLTMEDFYGTPATKTSPILPQNTPHPPTRVSLLIDVMEEIARLKEIRQQVADGNREADKKLTAEMYITQVTLSAYKIALEAQKEAAKIELTQNNFTQIDISERVNDLIQFSRERQCKKQKLAAPS